MQLPRRRRSVRRANTERDNFFVKIGGSPAADTPKYRAYFREFRTEMLGAILCFPSAYVCPWNRNASLKRKGSASVLIRCRATPPAGLTSFRRRNQHPRSLETNETLSEMLAEGSR